MSTQDAASLATREPNPVIDGRKANVNLAYLGAKPRVLPSATGTFIDDQTKRIHSDFLLKKRIIFKN